MEETFSSCNTDLSTHTNVNGEINFTSNSWTFDIDDTDSINFLHSFSFINNIDEISCFSWLTDNDYCLVFSDVVLIELGGICDMEFFEAF